MATAKNDSVKLADKTSACMGGCLPFADNDLRLCDDCLQSRWQCPDTQNTVRCNHNRSTSDETSLCDGADKN